MTETGYCNTDLQIKAEKMNEKLKDHARWTENKIAHICHILL